MTQLAIEKITDPNPAKPYSKPQRQFGASTIVQMLTYETVSHSEWKICKKSLFSAFSVVVILAPGFAGGWI
jgi:hypothetical protein